MQLSLFYFAFCLIVLLPKAEQTEFSLESCPSARRLLFFGAFNFSLGGKNTPRSSSSSKPTISPLSSPKSGRTSSKQAAKIYIRPQTATELGHKVRSYSHLLKPKVSKVTERTKLKTPRTLKKKLEKQKSFKKKPKSQQATKTHDLVAISNQERDRCRAVLGIAHQGPSTSAKTVKNTKTTKSEKATKPEKKAKPVKVINNSTASAKKPVVTTTKRLPEKNKPTKAKQEKLEKATSKSTADDKKKTATKPSETAKLTPPPKKEEPTKSKTSPPVSKPAPPTPPPPPPVPKSVPTTPAPPEVQTPSTPKPKREKTPATPPPPPPPPPSSEPEQPEDDSEDNEPIHVDNDNDQNEKNNSVVDRAYHFVKNMFLLSDDMLENNITGEEIHSFSSTNEERSHPSRKLLSIDDSTLLVQSKDHGDWQVIAPINILNDQQDVRTYRDLSSTLMSLSKRQLLSVKKTKRSIPMKETFARSKKTTSDAQKPKVGWTYRYRISRYLADLGAKRTGLMKKNIGGGRYLSKPITKKINSFGKFPKRKLLLFEDDENSEDDESNETEQLNQDDVADSVSVMQDFVPKRQLFNSKKKTDTIEESDGEDDPETASDRRRMKSYEEITDPIEIVRSYERGLFKPRVGWQFRYRVSRYIATLRENIREDQERLKLGLEAIKRKTPQELSGRRKRVLDKPFESEPEEKPAPEENKPSVGWRYRYRISKMLEAKQRGEYVDDEEERRKAREMKRKQHGLGKSDDDECVEWEYDHLDPELRKINEEGRRVGWGYRYRIRRKLDFLKKQQEESGVSFDLETLRSELDQKVVEAPKVVMEEVVEEAPKKIVGWQYRYRVSKMREAQEREAEIAAARGSRKSEDDIPIDQRLDPELARLTPAERTVGWQYRYRIRRKLDAMKDAARESQAGKRGKKTKADSKKSHGDKNKEKIIEKVEESIEKILNIDDIDETPFMEYFRRASSYILFSLLPTGRKSVCLLPLPVTFSFCNEDRYDGTKVTSGSPSSPPSAHIPTEDTSSESAKQSSTKKLRVKKEKRLKQAVPTRSIKSETTKEKAPEPEKPVAKTPVKTPEKTQRKPARPRASPPSLYDEQTKHFDEEQVPIRKVIGVETQRKKNKKRYQIIGTEVKVKNRNSSDKSQSTTTTTTTTTTAIPVTTTVSPSVKKSPSSDAETSGAQKSQTISTTHRTLSEIVQEEASTLLSSKSLYSEEAAEEVNEVNESLKVTTTVATPSASLNSNDDDESSSSDTDDDSEGEIGSDDEDEETEESDNDDDEDDDDDDDSDSNDSDSDSSPSTKNKLNKDGKKGVHDSLDQNNSS